MIGVTFYTLGGHAAGLGHIYRCIALAETFRQRGIEAQFAIRRSLICARIITQAGFRASTWAEFWTRQDLTGSIVIVDLPRTPRGLFSRLKLLGALTACMDDPAPEHTFADIAFHSLYECRAVRSRGEEYSGPAYQVLRSMFANLPSKHIRKRPERILIVQGGSDTYGMVPRLCRYLAKLQGDWKVDVLIGSAFKHIIALKAAASSVPERFRIIQGSKDVLGIMNGVDMAISGGGVMLFELAAAGVPTLTVSCEPKELETMAKMSGSGATADLGYGKRLTGKGLIDAVQRLAADVSLRRRMSRRMQKLVDGQGAERTVSRILERYEARRHA